MMKLPLSVAILSLGALLASCAEAVAEQRLIRTIDFRNFSYPNTCVGDATVVNGKFIAPIHGNSHNAHLSVRDVVYGDLTGDGAEEAVILHFCSAGGSQIWSTGVIYTMRDGKPVELPVQNFPGGDRAYGSIVRAEIRNGVLVLTQNDGSDNPPLCCPNFTVTQAYRLVGDRLVQVGAPLRKPIRAR